MNVSVSLTQRMKQAVPAAMRLCGILLLAALAGCSQGEKQAQRPLNVLFIAVDDLRPELGVYGASHIQSPNIDRLAAAGGMFTRAYCNVPVCGASRASLMSGMRPLRNRFVGFDVWLDEDAPNVLTLPEHFKNNGYYTVSLGKVLHHKEDALRSWSEPPWRPKAAKLPEGMYRSGRDYALRSNHEIEKAYRDAGDQRHRGMPYERASVADSAYFDGKIALKAIEKLRELSQQDQPFFLATGFQKPHLPFNAPQRYWDLYDPASISLADPDTLPEGAPKQAYHSFGELRAYHGIPESGPVADTMARNLIHGYYACVSYVDAMIGQVLDELERLQIADNTVVILWGDHGWSLGEHGLWCKHSPFEVALHVPLIVRGPGIQAGTRSHALTEFVDVYPSLCELASLPLPPHLAGESFVPALKNPDLAGKQAIFSRWVTADVVRTDRYHYSEWFDEAGGSVARMLYDQQTDADQLHNISEQPALAPQVEQLGQMVRERIQTDTREAAAIP